MPLTIKQHRILQRLDLKPRHRQLAKTNAIDLNRPTVQKNMKQLLMALKNWIITDEPMSELDALKDRNPIYLDGERIHFYVAVIDGTEPVKLCAKTIADGLRQAEDIADGRKITQFYETYPL